MMRREPSARLLGGKRRFSADGAEARGYNKYLGHILLKIAPATMKWKNYIFFKKWFLNHHVVSTIWKTETGFQYMATALHRRNPAAQTKLERA